MKPIIVPIRPAVIVGRTGIPFKSRASFILSLRSSSEGRVFVDKTRDTVFCNFDFVRRPGNEDFGEDSFEAKREFIVDVRDSFGVEEEGG